VSGPVVLAPTAAAEVGSFPASGTSAPVARLLRELCHDLMEPAASIKLLARALGASAGPDPAVQHRLRLIAAEASRIADICGQVLDRPTRQRPIRLDELAADTADSARLRHGSAIEVISSPVLLDIHPAVAIRILSNLVTNACQAAGQSGRVRLTITTDAEVARMEVADSGGAYRLGATGRTSFGLEIIWGLVLGCGGTVQMGVSELGGLCVTVLLPCRVPGEKGFTER
jgi:two-component system, OmpR family, sensor kinase